MLFQTRFIPLAIATTSIFTASLPAFSHDRPGMVPDIRALRVDTPPIIDGILDDPCWQKAEPITQFIQRNPNMGAPATFPVSVTIAYDPETIYIGFEIHCGEPSKLVSTMLQRDDPVNAFDDHFGFRFDTFHDHRSLYYFYINPKGTRLDGHAIDEGVTNDNNWDGVWTVKTRLLPDGWAGEIMMPLYNFRFRETEDGTWGFACLAYVSANQENVSWPDMRKNSRKPSLFGHITGLKGLNRQKPFVFIPYLVKGSKFGRHEKTVAAQPAWEASDDTWQSDAGLDIRYRPTNYLETNLTLNPDFATVEADQFLFNLTLDELQYPEKRPFFTEGQARFETPIELLYTRRIGLGDDEVIAGGKMHGRIGSYDFGVLDVMTGEGLDTDFNYSAVRLKKDVLRSSTIGVLAVGKNEVSPGMDGINQAVGLDFNFQISQAALLTGQFARSSRPVSGGNGQAGQVNFQYSDRLANSHDNLSVSFGLQDATDDFDIQDIGYFGRTSLDRRGIRGGLGYSYWIKSRGVNRFTVNQSGWYYQDHRGDVKVQDGSSFDCSIETTSLIAPGILLEKSYYFLPDTDLHYDNNQRTFSLKFGPYPRFRGNVSYRTGDNYGSSIRYLDSEVILKPSERMRLTLNYSHLFSDPFGIETNSSTNNIARLGLNYLFTPNMYCRVFLQSDSSDKLYLVNMLYRYEFRPGSVFYLSYKETRDDSMGGFMTSDRQLLAKVSYHLHL